MRYMTFLAALLLACAPIPSLAQEARPTTGLAEESIWYSQEPLVPGASVQVSTVVVNGGSTPLSGQVAFYDRDLLIGRKAFSAAANSSAIVSIDWTVTEGDHLVSARIEEASTTVSNPATRASRSFAGKEEAKPFELGEIARQARDIEEKVTAFLPGGDSIVGKTFRSTEAFRETQAERLDATKKDPEAGKTGKAFAGALAMVFHSVIAFYILLVMLVLGIVKFVLRKIF